MFTGQGQKNWGWALLESKGKCESLMFVRFRALHVVGLDP